jgi:hypothetical protein
MELVVCRAGDKAMKTHIFTILISVMEIPSSLSSTAMEANK